MDETRPSGETRRIVDWTDWIIAVLMHPIVLVGVGSAAGGNLRYWLGRWIDSQAWRGGLPWGTFVINVSGSLLLGFFAVAFLERLAPARRDLYLLLGTGLCGGYTTFSTFEWETFKLIREGDWISAFANVGGSVLAGFLGVVIGVYLAHMFLGRSQ